MHARSGRHRTDVDSPGSSRQPCQAGPYQRGSVGPVAPACGACGRAWLFLVAALALWSVPLAVTGQPAAPTTAPALSREQLDAVVQAGQEFLLLQRNADANWEAEAGAGDAAKPGAAAVRRGERSAVVVDGLVHSGLRTINPRMKPALEWVEGADLRGVAAVAARARSGRFCRRGRGSGLRKRTSACS